MRRSLAIVILLTTVARAQAAPPDFDDKVATILASHCLDCHSGGEPKGKLDLSRAALASKGGETGPAIVAANLDESLLWTRVAADEMPPKKPLSTDDKLVLKEWIASGAKWGTDPIDPYRVTTSKRAGYDWWALQPIKRADVPKVAGDSPARNDVDRFVLERLNAAKLTPSAPASREALVRRIYFDLVGLPPSPQEVKAFVDDNAPDAYVKLVNRLLDSPHYGERWARHWLDVAHFGESDGFEFDRMRPNAWPYRDWVIAALNADMPYDQFAKLQIAGDVLAPNDPGAITAAGFLVHGAFDSLVPAGDAMRQIMRQDELEDVVGLVGQTYLGLTVHCARCHDHKFDPIPTADYYRLASSLSGVRRGERTLPPRDIPQQLTNRIQELRGNLKKLDDLARERIAKASGEPVTKNAPTPLVSFDFDSPRGAGILPASHAELKFELRGGAKVESGALVVDGKDSFATSTAIDKEIREKTIEAWVKLDSLEQRGGAAISLQTLDGNVFDAIVFGEREPGQWMAGSDGFQRTQSFAGEKETASAETTVHFAIVYGNDGSITGYRNGELYGKSYKSTGPAVFRAGQSQLVFGLRHSPAGAGKMLTGNIHRAALYDRALSANEIAASIEVAGKIVTEAQLVASLTAEEKSSRIAATSELKALEVELTRLQSAKVYSITPKEPDAATHVLIRGNPQQLGEIVSPGGLTSIKFTPANVDLAPTSPEAERRRQLAEWIARRDNPLFARTMVNRVWHYHFGRGLIDTPSDLGFNGGQPSHPQLLDYLASEFMDSGWSLKHLHRLIVNSATYQQASLPRKDAMARDADNRLLWRYSPHRLDAESIRDAVLAVSGELNRDRGGPSFQDFRAYDNHNSQYYEPTDPVGREFSRRSIYRMWARGGKSPLLDTLDCPDPSTATPKRGSTTTPLQALAMLNNSFMLRMSDAMAARIVRESGANATAQVTAAFELAYCRKPREDERQLAVAFVEANSLAALCRVLLNTNGFMYVD